MGVGEQLQPRAAAAAGAGYKVLMRVVGLLLVAGVAVTMMVILGVIHINTAKWQTVYTANLTSSGDWTIANKPGESTKATAQGMVMTVSGKSRFFELQRSSYSSKVASLRMTATGSITAGAGPDSGLGVACYQDTTNTRYIFVISGDGTYVIERGSAVAGVTSIADGRVGGLTSVSTPHTIIASCVESSDANSTALDLTVDGTHITSLNDQWSAVTGSAGWGPGLELFEGSAPSVSATFTAFSVESQIN